VRTAGCGWRWTLHIVRGVFARYQGHGTLVSIQESKTTSPTGNTELRFLVTRRLGMGDIASEFYSGGARFESRQENLNYSDWGFHGFPLSLQANAGIIHLSRSRSLNENYKKCNGSPWRTIGVSANRSQNMVNAFVGIALPPQFTPGNDVILDTLLSILGYSRSSVQNEQRELLDK
jgi:hypothetical protein